MFFLNHLRLFFLVLMICSCKSNNDRKNTIKIIQENPAEYTDKKDFRLSKFTVVETTTFLNASFSIIDDTTGQMPLVLSKPLKKGQVLNGVKVRYVRLYSDSQQTIEYFIDKKSAEIVASYGPMVANFLIELSLKNKL